MALLNLKAELKVLAKQIENVEKKAGLREPTLPEFIPHVGQVQMLETAKRFNVAAMGRRFGKSALAVYLLVRDALEGWPVMLATPVYRQSTDAWIEMVYYLGDSIESKNAADRRIKLFTGGTIDIYSLDRPDRIRGKKYKTVLVDEAAFTKNLVEAFDLVIRPTLTDYEGSAWFMSSPNGFNDFHQLFARGEDLTRDEWQAWQMPTTDNPLINPKEIELARKDTPARIFQQEYEARFLASVTDGMLVRSWFFVIKREPMEAIKPVPLDNLPQTARMRVYRPKARNVSEAAPIGAS